jgi:AraC-like DNA-binding protein
MALFSVKRKHTYPRLESLQFSKQRAMTRQARVALRREFVAQIGSIAPFQQLFCQIVGVHFCLKDAKSRLIWGNEALFQRLNIDEDDLPGTTDYDFFPKHISESFIKDDLYVLTTGKPIIHRVAVWYNEQHILDWFVKNKFPIRNRSGKIIGLIVSIQSYEGMRSAHTPFSDISDAINYIREHLNERISVAGLAKRTGVSPRHLHRKFQRAFGLSVQQFLTKTRIQAAEDRLLRTSDSIAAIAQQFGFCDQSAFTEQFRKNTGLTPRKFRVQNAVTPCE